MSQEHQSAPNNARRSRHLAALETQGALARELDDPQRQSSARQWRRPEGRRPPGLVRLARHHHDRALFRRAAAAGPRRGEAACQPDLPRHPVSARQADAREAGGLPRLQGRAELSLAHQGRRRRRFLDRLGRPRRRADAVLLAGAGLRARAWLGPRTGRKGAWSRWSATPSSTKATSSRRCSKAGSRACAIAGGSSTTTGRASTPSCAKGCGSATSSCSRISAGTW